MSTAIIIDDSPVESSMLQRILGKAGISVLAVSHDGEHGWNLVRESRPDWVTLDINLPNMSGLEIARLIVEQKLTTKIIFCTGAHQGAVIRQMSSIGAAKRISKPFDDILTVREIKALING